MFIKKRKLIYYEIPELGLPVFAFMHLHFLSLYLCIPSAFTCIFHRFLQSFNTHLISAEVSIESKWKPNAVFN